MELLLVRHAIAEDPSADRPDALRALTGRGRRRFRAVVAGLTGLGLQVELVLHSPWLRARQTAELMAPLLSADGSLRRCDALARPPDEALLGELTAPRVALVGHEPWVGQLAALLLTGRASTGAALPFKKGGVAWLEGDPRPGRMALRAFLPPRVSTNLHARTGLPSELR